MLKKAVCFAGFGDDELETLQQAMAGISGAWDCVFAPDAAATLEALKSRPFDAVVAEMQMKGMNGAELLQRAGELHPATLRFVIGDLADQELILNCIGGTHQFISRPYKPQELISVVQRSFALDACLSSDQLRAIAPKLGRLPTLPTTYFEVLKRIESRDASADSVGEVIARDPAATARVLQMVNSAAFALAQKVSDPSHAVLLLGLETVKSLVLCLQVFNKIERTRQTGFSMEQLWEHSSAVAKKARDIVLAQTADGRLASDAFTAGLLHDMGRIILASNLTKEYTAVVAAARQKSCSLHEEELAQLGVTHAQVGAYLLGLWGMPASLVEAAALHHTPGLASTEFSLLTAVHIADVLAHENDAPENGLPLPQLDTAYLEAVGVAHKVAEWRGEHAGQPRTGDTERVARPARSQAPAAPAPVPARVTPKRAPAAARGSGSGWILKYLFPAAVAVAIAVALGLWKGWSDLTGSLAVHAKSDNAIQTAASSALPSTVDSAQPMAKESTEAVAVADPPAAASRAAQERAPTPTASLADTNSAVKAPEVAGPAAARPPAAKAQTTTPAPPVAVTPASGFENVKLQGIFYTDSQQRAIVSGKLLGPGERLGNVQVVSIGPASIVLSCNGQQRTFKLK
jgi:HD-like signal output (HDOD) protein/CheY-like chemotaxis protein